MLVTLPVPQPPEVQVEAVADLLECTLDRSSGETACLSTTTAKAITPRFAFLSRSRPSSIAANRSFRTIVPFHGALLPFAMMLACSSTSCTAPTPRVETNRSVSENKVVDHPLEHRDAREDEMAFRRVPDRPGVVKIEEVHEDRGGVRGKHSWWGHLAPADRATTAFPTVGALSTLWCSVVNLCATPVRDSARRSAGRRYGIRKREHRTPTVSWPIGP